MHTWQQVCFTTSQPNTQWLLHKESFVRTQGNSYLLLEIVKLNYEHVDMPSANTRNIELAILISHYHWFSCQVGLNTATNIIKITEKYNRSKFPYTLLRDFLFQPVNVVSCELKDNYVCALLPRVHTITTKSSNIITP